MMAIPALSSVLQKFKDQDYDIEAIADDYYWFNAIMVSYENVYGKKLTNESFNEIDSLTLANDSTLYIQNGTNVVKEFNSVLINDEEKALATVKIQNGEITKNVKKIVKDK